MKAMVIKKFDVSSMLEQIEQQLAHTVAVFFVKRQTSIELMFRVE